MPPKEPNDACHDERKDAIEKMNEIVKGLSRRFKSPEQFLDEEYIETILEVNKQVLPQVEFERNWNDHYKFIESLIKVNNKANDPFLHVNYKRLGNLGILLTTEHSNLCETKDKTKNPVYHPFAILLAANIKHQFRDLSITLKPTKWKGTISETEIIMQ
jgi:hypothetical protein